MTILLFTPPVSHKNSGVFIYHVVGAVLLFFFFVKFLVLIATLLHIIVCFIYCVCVSVCWGICTCLCGSVELCMQLHVYVQVEVKGQEFLLNHSSPLFFETGSLTKPKAHNSARLAGQGTLGICLSLSQIAPSYSTQPQLHYYQC